MQRLKKQHECHHRSVTSSGLFVKGGISEKKRGVET
jgi:hypothetical protein